MTLRSLLLAYRVNWKTTAFSNVILVLLGLLTSLAVQAQWTPKADALKKRYEGPSVVYNNKMYTFMGFGSNLNAESSGEVYDPATNTWSPLAPIPSGRAVTHQGVALIDNTVWHIGGRVGNNPGPLTNQIWIYNISTDSWSQGPNLVDPANGTPLTWGGGAALLVGRTLHVLGGFIVNACSNDQDKYHLTLDVDQWLTTGVANWTNERKPLPLKRCHIAHVTLGGKIYVLGGQFDHDCGEKDQAFVQVYDPILDTWTQLNNLPDPRSHAEGGTFTIDGKIYLVAGQLANSTPGNKVTVYDPAGNNGAGSVFDDPAFNLPANYEGVTAKVISSTFIYSHGAIDGPFNTQNKTYTRTIVRNPINQFGFTAPCFTLTVNAGQVTTGKNLLFTIDNPRAYSLSSDAGWLTITKNATGTALHSGVDIGFAVNTAGLAPGTYTGTITASATGAGPTYAPARCCVTLTVVGTGGQPTVRLNAGGGTFSASGGRGFAADAYFSGGNTYSVGSTAIDHTTDDALYQTERWGNFSYNVPVSNGNYAVVLHFSEVYFGVAGRGTRQFNVDIEGVRKLTNYDIAAKAGGSLKAVQETIPVTVSDGTLTIAFSAGSSDNPKVSAIEILPLTQQAVMSYSLINADSDQPIKLLTPGELLNLANLPTRNLTIRANTVPDTTGSVVMQLSGTQSRNQTETVFPYALFGDNVGNYLPWTPAVGSYTLTGTPYTGSAGTGSAGLPQALSFTVIDQPTGGRLLAEGERESTGLQVIYFPNPFTQSFTLQVPHKGAGKVPLFMYDAHGRVILQQEDVPCEQTVSVGQEYIPGLYFLQVGTGKSAKRYKLLKGLQ